MRRREFLTLVGGASVPWPLAAWAQQPAMPVIGLLDQRSPDELAAHLRGFRQGLRDSGFVEGQNVAIEYRWAENKLCRCRWADELRDEHSECVPPSWRLFWAGAQG